MEQQKTEQQIKDELNNFILQWHRTPVDYWWRKKYNVPFGSQRHREMNLIDMLIEYREDQYLNELREQIRKEEDEREMRAIGIESNEVKMSQEEIDEEYENLDLSQFDK